MIFSVRNLGFELGSLLLEGWAAFAARVVCAALLLVFGWLARQLLSRKVCPAVALVFVYCLFAVLKTCL